MTDEGKSDESSSGKDPFHTSRRVSSAAQISPFVLHRMLTYFVAGSTTGDCTTTAHFVNRLGLHRVGEQVICAGSRQRNYCRGQGSGSREHVVTAPLAHRGLNEGSRSQDCGRVAPLARVRLTKAGWSFKLERCRCARTETSAAGPCPAMPCHVAEPFLQHGFHRVHAPLRQIQRTQHPQHRLPHVFQGGRALPAVELQQHDRWRPHHALATPWRHRGRFRA